MCHNKNSPSSKTISLQRFLKDKIKNQHRHHHHHRHILYDLLLNLCPSKESVNLFK